MPEINQQLSGEAVNSNQTIRCQSSCMTAMLDNAWPPPNALSFSLTGWSSNSSRYFHQILVTTINWPTRVRKREKGEKDKGGGEEVKARAVRMSACPDLGTSWGTAEAQGANTARGTPLWGRSTHEHSGPWLGMSSCRLERGKERKLPSIRNTPRVEMQAASDFLLAPLVFS